MEGYIRPDRQGRRRRRKPEAPKDREIDFGALAIKGLNIESDIRRREIAETETPKDDNENRDQAAS